MSADSLLGQTLDEYRLVAVLGRGGMARVYRGLDLRLQRFAAIKVIDTQYRADPEYVARFEREARTIAQLDHPHIVRLYRYGNVDGLLYMAMQYIQGADLDYVLNSYRADGTLIEPADAARLIREVCLALDYAHAQGVIHRDIKPSNILLDPQGRAILSDFGLALLADIGTSGRILGSPHYVAPEQALSSAKAVPQSDLYSVGVILYEMFTGRVPFAGAEPMDVALMQVQDAPRPPRELRPEISPALEAVILQALAKDPTQRHANGAALAAALDDALRPALARPVAATIARQSIPDRVALQMAKHPVPHPVPPPAPAAPAVAPVPTAAEAPAPYLAPQPTVRRPPLALSAGLIVVVALSALVACGLLVVWLGSQAAGVLSLPAATRTPAVATATQPAETTNVSPGREPTALPSSTPVPLATATPPASATPLPPAGPELLLVRAYDNDALIVINRGTAPLRLDALVLSAGRESIEGADWSLEQLPAGACVAAWDEAEDRRTLPEGINCDLMGEALERRGRDRVWRETFEVFYDGERLARCERREDLCVVSSGP